MTLEPPLQPERLNPNLMFVYVIGYDGMRTYGIFGRLDFEFRGENKRIIIDDSIATDDRFFNKAGESIKLKNIRWVKYGDNGEPEARSSSDLKRLFLGSNTTDGEPYPTYTVEPGKVITYVIDIRSNQLIPLSEVVLQPKKGEPTIPAPAPPIVEAPPAPIPIVQAPEPQPPVMQEEKTLTPIVIMSAPTEPAKVLEIVKQEPPHEVKSEAAPQVAPEVVEKIKEVIAEQVKAKPLYTILTPTSIQEKAIASLPPYLKPPTPPPKITPEEQIEFAEQARAEALEREQNRIVEKANELLKAQTQKPAEKSFLEEYGILIAGISVIITLVVAGIFLSWRASK